MEVDNDIDAEGDSVNSPGSQVQEEDPTPPRRQVPARKPIPRASKKAKVNTIELDSDVEIDYKPIMVAKKQQPVKRGKAAKGGKVPPECTNTLEEERSWNPLEHWYGLAIYNTPCDYCLARQYHKGDFGEFTRTCMRVPWDGGDSRAVPRSAACMGCKCDSKGCIRSGPPQIRLQFERMEWELPKITLSPEECKDLTAAVKTQAELRWEAYELAHLFKRHYRTLKEMGNRFGVDITKEPPMPNPFAKGKAKIGE